MKKFLSLFVVFAFAVALLGCDGCNEPEYNDFTSESLTEDVIDDMLHEIHNDGGKPDVMVCSYGVAKTMKKITAPYRRFNDKIDLGLGSRVLMLTASLPFCPAPDSVLLLLTKCSSAPLSTTCFSAVSPPSRRLRSLVSGQKMCILANPAV